MVQIASDIEYETCILVEVMSVRVDHPQEAYEFFSCTDQALEPIQAKAAYMDAADFYKESPMVHIP